MYLIGLIVEYIYSWLLWPVLGCHSEYIFQNEQADQGHHLLISDGITGTLHLFQQMEMIDPDRHHLMNICGQPLLLQSQHLTEADKLKEAAVDKEVGQLLAAHPNPLFQEAEQRTPHLLPESLAEEALAPAEQRYQMVVRALKGNPRFEVSDLELARGGISYSAQTLERLKSFLGRSRLFFIAGSDFLKDFSRWKNIERIHKICKFAVAQRPGCPFRRIPPNMQAINVTSADISSSDIRKRIRAKKSVRYLLPEEVRKYILRKGLYR